MSRFAAVVCLGLCMMPSMMLGRQGSLDFGRWRNFTNMHAVTGVAASLDSVWVSTTGGLFLYTPSTSYYTKFTNSEGISSNDLTAVALDGSGRVWIGASDGSINVYDPGTREWREIRAIRDSDRIRKAIRTFLVHGDSLLVGTDFGITVFLLSRFEFRDTYATFGFQTQAGINNILIHKNRIWAATDFGVVSAPLSAINLSSPMAWDKYEMTEGLPAKDVSSIVVFRDTILAGTSLGLAFFDGAMFQPLSSTSGRAIAGMLARANDLLIVLNDAQTYTAAILSYTHSSLSVLASNIETSATAVALEASSAPGVNEPADQSGFWVGTSTKGLARWTGSNWEYAAPRGPQSNLFSSIVVDDNGILWAASGISDRGQGFYRYDPSAPDRDQWKNYTVADYPVMQKNDYYKVSLGANGSVWVSSWGWGVVEVVGDSIRRKLDVNSVPALATSVTNDSIYPVIGGVAADSKGNTWIVNRTAINGNHLVQLASDNVASYYRSPSSGLFTNMVIDRYNTKWLACAEPWNKPANGVFYFNEDMLVSGTSATGGWGSMTKTDGLPASSNDYVYSLAVDLDGDVCVGTDVGMIIITDPRNPKAAASRTISYPLRTYTIQAIAVDAVNNKWVGTTEGVIVVSPDGMQVLAQYTVASTNGKLLSNDIRSIALDQKRGIAYFGTEKGLSSLEIAPVQSARTLSSLKIGPNPYLIPAAQFLTIGNLASETSIKILTINGALVTEFRAQAGGRAFWDGRDQKGELVSSGVYVVVAYAENGNQVTTGKVAVIRR